MSSIASLVCIGSLLLQSFTCANIENPNREKKRGRRQKNDVKHGFFYLRLLHAARRFAVVLRRGMGVRRESKYGRLCSELDEDRHIQPVLGLTKIGVPSIRWRTIANGEAAEANQ